MDPELDTEKHEIIYRNFRMMYVVKDDTGNIK
jgi:hypothetical protein